MGDTTRPTSPSTSRAWVAGVGSGILAGIGMGIVLAVGTNLLPLVGALYGLPGAVGGWLAHLFNSAVFGLLFAVLVSRPVVRQGTSRADYVVLGVAYGAGLGLVTGGVLLPLWLEVGGVSSLAVPFLPIPGFVNEFTAALVLAVSHLVYGVLLGAAYAETSGVVLEPRPGATSQDSADREFDEFVVVPAPPVPNAPRLRVVLDQSGPVKRRQVHVMEGDHDLLQVPFGRCSPASGFATGDRHREVRQGHRPLLGLAEGGDDGSAAFVRESAQ